MTERTITVPFEEFEGILGALDESTRAIDQTHISADVPIDQRWMDDHLRFGREFTEDALRKHAFRMGAQWCDKILAEHPLFDEDGQLNYCPSLVVRESDRLDTVARARAVLDRFHDENIDDWPYRVKEAG